MCQCAFKPVQLLMCCVALGLNSGDALFQAAEFAQEVLFALFLRTAMAPMPAPGLLHSVLDLVLTGVSPILFSGTQRLHPRKRLQLYLPRDLHTFSVFAVSCFRVP